MRRFLARFAGQRLKVALEATTGWRFFVEELRAVGAVVHLAGPAETAALRGNKKRAKTDRADARHHRELLLAGRLPESWIPPDHILDLRARVRLRHKLIEAHTEWQQRIQAVLYHHGCPARRKLMEGDGRDWLDAQPLPETAREQITVALAVIDALERQTAPLVARLRPYARRQAGCKALIERYYGIGELVAVIILAELGDCRRFQNSRDAVRYGGMERCCRIRHPSYDSFKLAPYFGRRPLRQTVKDLTEQGWTALAFRVDRLEPFLTPTPAAQMDLGEVNPVVALATVAEDRPSVLVINQLGAVSFASGRLPRQFDPIVELLEQTKAFPEMRALLACRQFDVDNDPRLGALIAEDGPARPDTVGALTDEEVDAAVRELGIDPSRLSSDLIQ